MKNAIWAAAVIFVVTTGQVLGQPAAEWDLRQSLEIGLKNNPRIIAGKMGVEGARARIDQNLAGYYPFLFAETNYSRFKGSFSGGGGSAPENNLYAYYLGLSQNIYDFGRREFKVQASREDLKGYQLDFKDIRLLVMDNIRQAYYGVLLTDRLVKVRLEDLERTQQNLRQAQGFYQVGLKAKIDVTQAEVEVIKAQKTLLNARNDAQLSRVVFEQALGLERKIPGRDYYLKDDLEIGKVEWKLDDLKKEALENHTLLNRLRTTVRYWEAQEKAVSRDFWPSLTGTAKYGYANLEALSLVDVNWSVGLQLNIPIFSGFETKSKVAEVKAILSQAKANEEVKRLEVLTELEGQYLNLVLAEKQIEVTNENLRAARENLDLAMGRYKAGVGTMLEITDARVSLSQAEVDHIQALFDYKRARFKIEKTLGREEY